MADLDPIKLRREIENVKASRAASQTQLATDERQMGQLENRLKELDRVDIPAAKEALRQLEREKDRIKQEIGKLRSDINKEEQALEKFDVQLKESERTLQSIREGK